MHIFRNGKLFPSQRDFGRKKCTTFKNYILFYAHNTCIICNYIGNICNYMRKTKPTAFQVNMNQDFFPFFSVTLQH